jgi:anaerobic magnesium-protoporphyrin IX monomethyl ester cyclase
VHLAYLAALAAEAGHEVRYTERDLIEGDVALILSSIVDYRRETAFADQLRGRGVRVGFVGLAASKLPELFEAHADFVVNGEPEAAMRQMLQSGDIPAGPVASEAIEDLDTLPFPRWDLVAKPRPRLHVPYSGRPVGGGFPLLASRGCPEFCTYCPHRILAGYRSRSVERILDEIQQLASRYRRPYVIFRDPLFSQDRDRCLALAIGLEHRRLEIEFECETRLDRLDPDLLERLRAVGLRAISFGVESMSPDTLRKVGRRPTPPEHQRLIIETCRRLGIVTAAFFVLGFLEDDWDSIAATIDYAVDLGSTVAQFKLLTPYPGTPLWKRLAPRIVETDWERFDGFTPTFTHPHLSHAELRFLLGAAYARFYVRPSYLANYLRLGSGRTRAMAHRLDSRVRPRHTREEFVSRTVPC